MEFFRISRDLQLMKRALIFNAISLITFLAAVFFLVHRGLHLSVEFTGGTVVEVQYPQAVPLEPVRGTLGALGYPDAQVQNFGTSCTDSPAVEAGFDVGAAERSGDGGVEESGRAGSVAARGIRRSAGR